MTDGMFTVLVPCRSRKFQYGVKYWCLNTLVLCGAILFSELEQPGHLASWHPLFLVATVNVVFSEKVCTDCYDSICMLATVNAQLSKKMPAHCFYSCETESM